MEELLAFVDEQGFAFVAVGLVRNGITAVLFNYALCPSVNNDEFVRQSRAAVARTYRNAENFGGNPEQISISGHSAGGHLTGMLLGTDWGKTMVLPPNLNRGICLSAKFLALNHF